ncbi:MAG: DUF3592 domain-containing protein [Methylacidiphilales bacterium]|nr:DUF3592 domain-containing protein [Candidatus Methylacidiphilales bacterium]
MLTLLILVLFPFVIWQAYKKLRLSKASATWPTAPGVVTAAERTKLAWRTQPRVSFSYEVAGKAYNSSKVSFADVVPARETEPTLSRYQPKQQVVVHYQPEDPGLAVLEPGPNRYVSAAFRNYIIWFVLLIFFNVLYIGLTVWQHTQDMQKQPVHTYDDVAKADPQLGNRLLREAAEKGDAKDQVYVAIWYLTGKEGYPKNPAEAAKWFRKAADQGDAEAQNWLAVLYNSGNGVEKNTTLAFEWLNKAGAQGEPHACYSLGYASEKGIGGTPQDTQKAIEWYRKAGNEPHSKAALARLHADP